MNTISLKKAKRLSEVCKEKGVVLPGTEYSYWRHLWQRDCQQDFYLDSTEEVIGRVNYHKDNKPEFHIEEVYPAPVADELLEILPWGVFKDGDRHRIISYKNQKKKKSRYTANLQGIKLFDADTPAEALAELLIYLIKEGIYEQN